MATFRIASFNVENLFARPKVFNFKDRSVGDALLERIGDFRKILKKSNYSTSDKNELLSEYNTGTSTRPPLKDYINIREDRGKLWKKRGWSITGVRADGSGDWDGTVFCHLRGNTSNLAQFHHGFWQHVYRRTPF